MIAATRHVCAFCEAQSDDPEPDDHRTFRTASIVEPNLVVCSRCESAIDRRSFPKVPWAWTDADAVRKGYLPKPLPPLRKVQRRKWTDAQCLARYPAEVVITYPDGRVKHKGGGKKCRAIAAPRNGNGKAKVQPNGKATREETVTYCEYVQMMGSVGLAYRPMDEWLEYYRNRKGE